LQLPYYIAATLLYLYKQNAAAAVVPGHDGSSAITHLGFVLQTEKGPIKLRREGGNPFYDDFFEMYENQEISVEGYDMGQYFLVTAIDKRTG
jgi:hypothetical protein